MSFLTWTILPGLALAAIPVILHLLNRRQVQVVNWAAMRFLHDVIAHRRRRIQPEDLLLMLLRTLLLVVLVLALAEPLLKNHNFLGDEVRQDVVLIVDGSASTTLARDNGRLFDAQVRDAVQLLDRLKPGDTVSVLLASQSPVWLTPQAVIVTPTSRVELQKVLTEAKPLAGGMDVIRSLDAAAARLAEGRNPYRQIVLVTDGQAAGWDAGDTQRWQYLRDALAKNQPTPKLRVLTVAPPPDNVVNVAVTDVRLERNAVGVGRPVKATIVLANTGLLASGARTLRVSVDGQEQASLPVTSLEPGAQTTLELPVVFRTAGSSLLTVGCPADEPITLDDRYDLAVNVLDRLPVLVVDGAPSGRAQDAESYYVSAALNPAGGAGRGAASAPADSTLGFVADVKTVTIAQLPLVNLPDYAAVLLLNPPALPTDAIRKLRAYVEQGGGVLFAPGPQTDPGWVSAQFLDSGQGLLPAALEDRAIKQAGRGAAADGSPARGVQSSNADHPAIAAAVNPGRSDIELAKVFEYWKLREPQPRDELRQVILRLSDQAPLAVLGTLGKGRVVELAVPLDADWTNWPARRFFPVLLNELVAYLAEPQVPSRHLASGLPLTAAFPAAVVPAGWVGTVTDPLGRTGEVVLEPQNTQTLVKAGTAGLVGVYRVKLNPPEGTAGAAMQLLFTVPAEERETRLPWLTADERTELSRKWDLAFFNDVTTAGEALAIDVPGTRLSAWLLAAVLVLLLAEILATRLIARRRNAGVPAMKVVLQT